MRRVLLATFVSALVLGCTASHAGECVTSADCPSNAICINAVCEQAGSFDAATFMDAAPHSDAAVDCDCEPGQIEIERDSCGDCRSRMRTRACTQECTWEDWGPWSDCQPGGICEPDEIESERCGNCGTRSRTCTSECEWGAWSDCSGEGECVAGTVETALVRQLRNADADLHRFVRLGNAHALHRRGRVQAR